MMLKKMLITKNEWGTCKGQYTGEIEFENHLGDVKLNLNPEQCDLIFHVVAEEIVNTAKSIATELTSEVIEAAHGQPSALTQE